MDKNQATPADGQLDLVGLQNDDGLHLTRSQKKAYQRLEFLANTKFAGMHKLAGIETRPLPLLIGASGSGKTALVREYARRTDLPLFAVSVTSWIVLGAKCNEYTLTALKNFVERHGRGVVFLDELNKLRSNHTESSAWSMSVLTEIMGILDGDVRLIQNGFSEDQAKAFKENFFIVGAGAWQEEWCASKGVATMGFGGSPGGEAPDSELFLNSVKRSNVIPQELLFRFNERVILIEPPDKDEIAERITAIRNAHPQGTSRAPDELIVDLAKKASASECPMRWLEAYVATTLEGHSSSQIAVAAAERMQQLKGQSHQVTYTNLYNSTFAIVKRLAHETSLAARDLAWWLRSERGYSGSPLYTFITDFAFVASEFTLPTISDRKRSEIFDGLRERAAKASRGFVEFMGPDLVDVIRPGTHDSARKFLVLAAQFSTEAEVIRQIMMNPDALAKDNIKDHVDNRINWFCGHA